MMKARLRALMAPDDDVWPSRPVSQRGLLGLATGTYSNVLPSGLVRAGSAVTLAEASVHDDGSGAAGADAVSTVDRSTVAKSAHGRAAARAAASAIAVQVRVAAQRVCGSQCAQLLSHATARHWVIAGVAAFRAARINGIDFILICGRGSPPCVGVRLLTNCKCYVHAQFDSFVPRRWLEWRNKPKRNRVVADYAGFPSEPTRLTLSPDGQLLAVGFQAPIIHVMATATGELVRELNNGGHTEGITCVAFSFGTPRGCAARLRGRHLEPCDGSGQY